jgi:hypothetical protein
MVAVFAISSDIRDTTLLKLLNLMCASKVVTISPNSSRTYLGKLRDAQMLCKSSNICK